MKKLCTIAVAIILFAGCTKVDVPTPQPPTANTPKAKANYVLLSERPKQPQTVSATTGAVATSASTGRGGKRRTHRKCHTKKTRRTQKNHKRKRHGTQRKRSQRQRV